MSSFCRPPVSIDMRKLVYLVEQFLQVHCQMSIELISQPDVLLANTFLLLFASCFYHTVFYKSFDGTASQDAHSSSSVRNVFLLYIFV